MTIPQPIAFFPAAADHAAGKDTPRDFLERCLARLETGATHMASETDDVVLSARERNQNREEAMREYLAWEINLVNEMATDDDHRFQVVA